MRRTWSGAAVLVAALGFVVAGGAAQAVADPHNDQQTVDRELARTKSDLEAASGRVQNAAAAYQAATAQLPIAQQHLADARGLLAGARAHAVSTARDARVAATDLAAANAALNTAARRVDQTRDAINAFVVEAYKGSDLVGYSALLTATSPADFVAGLTYLGHIAEVRQEGLDANVRARTAERNRQNLKAGRDRAAAAADQAAADAVFQAQTAEAAAEQATQQVTDLIARQAAALKLAGSQRASTLARYRELQAESDRIAARIRAQANPGGQVVRPGARLPMPVVGWKSSDCGMRFDPYYHVWQLHAGVDLAAAAGTPIWAVAGGRVIQAGWDGGYGNYTCIYHGTYQGKAFATCYAHQSQILVHVGQQVRQGQVIGRVGTTGASTGDHLHFEVRLDGVPVDPVPWLPACLC